MTLSCSKYSFAVSVRIFACCCPNSCIAEQCTGKTQLYHQSLCALWIIADLLVMNRSVLKLARVWKIINIISLHICSVTNLSLPSMYVMVCNIAVAVACWLIWVAVMHQGLSHWKENTDTNKIHVSELWDVALVCCSAHSWHFERYCLTVVVRYVKQLKFC